MVRWHDQLGGHEFEQTPRDGKGQGSLVCCSPWGHKELDLTEQLSYIYIYLHSCVFLFFQNLFLIEGHLFFFNYLFIYLTSLWHMGSSIFVVICRNF